MLIVFGDDTNRRLEASLRHVLDIDKHKVFKCNVNTAVIKRFVVARPQLVLYNARGKSYATRVEA